MGKNKKDTKPKAFSKSLSLNPIKIDTKKEDKNKKEAQKDETTHKYTKYNEEISNIHQHFSKYIIKGKDDFRYECIQCKKKNNPNFSGFYDHLSSHLQSEKHENAVLGVGDDSEIPAALEALNNFRSKKKKVKIVKKETIDSMRIDLTGFLLENELPFNLAPKLSVFSKKH